MRGWKELTHKPHACQLLREMCSLKFQIFFKKNTEEEKIA